MSAWPQLNSIQWLASFLLLVLLFYCFKQRSQRISVPLATFIGLTLTWSLCAALLPFALTLEDKIILNRIKMVGASLVSLSICRLAAVINGEIKVSRWVWVVASLVHVISVIIVVSPYHEFLIKNYAIRQFADGELLTYANGPWFPVHSLVARILLLGAFFFLWKGMKSLHSFHRTRNKLIIISILIPSVLDTLAVYFYPELRFLQIVPTALAFSSIILVYAVFGHEALEVLPFARAEIVEHMADPCTMWDERGLLMDFNPAAGKALQLESTSIGKKIQALEQLPLELRTRYPWSDTFELEIGPACFSAEQRSVINQHGINLGTILILKDVSGQKRVERELRGINQVKTTFMGILTHDISANVATIAHSSELLLRDYEKMAAQDREAILEAINHGARDVNEFILQLSDWARTQFRTLKVERKPLDMSVVFAKVSDYLRPLVIEKSLSLHFSIPMQTMVSADAQMIETVVRNLLANAIKFSPPESEVYVSAVDAGPAYKFSIVDQGQNIDVDRLNAFFQDTLADDTTASFGSQGLGLLLCRGFIRLHQGHIWAEKMNNGGGAIHFYLDKLGDA